ncbi:SMC-Scp complex subunit ScpB [Candidatus Woesearchaeota archaeon]|nr:SMC-Scp complex subunit ScpB [Candidatus Woesearchaeota archaeon]
MADKKASAKSKVEAILFSVGHKISLDEVSRLSRARKEEVLAALKELQAEYDQKQSSLMLVDEGDLWKFTVRDHLISVVRKIVTETELTKSVMETLAVIAFKYPILQSDMIKLRTNKAYDHLVELEKAGYISRQKFGRTNLIKLTEKFFKYFDLTEDQLREQFKDFDSIAMAIKDKESEVEQIKEGQRKKAEELKQQDEKIRQEIKSLDKVDEEFSIPLEKYDSIPQEAKENIELKQKETIENLEIVNIPKEERKEEARQEKTESEKETEENKIEKETKTEKEAEKTVQAKAEKEDSKMGNKIIMAKKARKKSKGIQVTKDMEKKIDERVQQIVQGEKDDSNQFLNNQNI